MTYDTINDAMTIAGNGEGTLLANRYRVVRQLGQGGMGSVWLAEDTQLDNKPFAIKMLPAILVSNKRAYRQLKDEALVAMKLTHPNIVTLRAFEENNGNPFLVMDYIDGQTLDDYLAEHTLSLGEAASRRFESAPLGEAASRRFESAPLGEAASRRFTGATGVPPVASGLPEADVLRILRPIAAALDYAHGEGVVHRDVKPANVMIRKDGHPFILDFGIAREIQETMTRVTGKLSSGTLLYMSPEQLNGDHPKPAQDIYSFAAMVYECLKGEPPFVRGAIEDQIKNKQPDPLSTEARTGKAAILVADALTGKAAILAAGVMAGLAKKPENRPASCMAVLEGKDFSRVEHVERVDGDGGARRPAEPEGRRVPMPPQSGGPRPVAAVKGILAAALIAALAGGAWWLASGRNGTTGTSGTTGTNVVHVSAVSGVSDVPSSASAPRTTEPRTKTFVLPGGVKMEMIYVEPGSFMMGSPETEDGHAGDETQHRVTLTKGYWLGKYEVTQRQWESVMGENPSHFKGPDRPVENVSWDDCQRFIAKVDAEARQQFGGGARLPTEAEWEYACRANTTTAYSWGNALNGDKANCNGNYPCGTTVKGCYRGETADVGSYSPNDWGFHDMHGNVWEWCSDRYGSYGGDAMNSTGAASGDYRVLRGGSWGNFARLCRSASRNRRNPGLRHDDRGFRLCCSAE